MSGSMYDGTPSSGPESGGGSNEGGPGPLVSLRTATVLLGATASGFAAGGATYLEWQTPYAAVAAGVGVFAATVKWLNKHVGR
ncbi:hypothetical protein [Streptomyces omiyaensis]|uniref:hypothetical protein n=1 Tax=Streptomyces omiyaensis TaxID=68247 RepID=UPI001676EBDB|nr:hypothetical protein [Streptomyces omiyaensis]GGY71569.1 hypothetical protein GCM10010363_61190 [Streptomyces omiyaensis]